MMMKNLKLWTVALVLLTGFVATSCLGDDDENDTTVRTNIGKLYSSYGGYLLKTTDGYSVTPSPNSVASALANGVDLSQYAGEVLYFAYDLSGATVDEVAKTATNVNFTGCMSLSNPVEVVYGTEADGLPNDSVGNTPIISLEHNGEKPQMMFDDVTLYVPANYIMERMENHVTLVYYTDEPADNTDDVMRLHLRYNSTGNELSTSVTSLEYYNYNLYYYLKFFDLSEAVRVFQGRNGTAPSSIQIVVQENPYSTDLDDERTAEKVYTVTR